jgi:DNA-binding NarL/FixJ family response regulator
VTGAAPCARVLIADDHLLTRAGLRAVLAEDPEFEVVGEAVNGAQAVSLCQSLHPDLVLMDVQMPHMSGLEATRAIKQADPATAVLILSMFEDADVLLDAIRSGAAGYVLKHASEADLCAAMHDALAGNFPIDRRLVRDVLWQVATEAPAPPPAQPAGDLLSNRECDVLGLLTRGCTNPEIAEQLVISSSTVKAHVEHILAKLGVRDRTQAALRAIQLGYVTDSVPHPPIPKASLVPLSRH